MSYYDLDDAPRDDREFQRRKSRNNEMDCRDPDHDGRLCPFCSPQDEDEE